MGEVEDSGIEFSEQHGIPIHSDAVLQVIKEDIDKGQLAFDLLFNAIVFESK